ncbi:MAG: PAQR family membrane homeostasis protein TrhA [Acholeplasmataceae bacterium]|jgi:hemolysin III
MKKFKRRDKKQSLGEELANAISHGVAALLGIVGLILLLIKSDNVSEYVGSSIFGASIILLYTMSTLYHSFPRGNTKGVFKRFDHVSIYLLIGGTFAPIFLITLESPLKWIMLASQWAIIIVGIVLKAVKVYKFQKLHIVLFLLLGWSGLFFIPNLYNYGHSLWFILAGGISYSIGVIFYALRPFKYSHFIWHLFVIGGTALQFFAIYLYLLT